MEMAPDTDITSDPCWGQRCPGQTTHVSVAADGAGAGGGDRGHGGFKLGVWQVPVQVKLKR